MTDRRAEPMDPFELELARGLREVSAVALRSVDAFAVAAAAARTPRRSVVWPMSRSRLWFAVLAMAVVIALLAAIVTVGHRIPAPPFGPGHVAYATPSEVFVADADGSNAIRVSTGVSDGHVYGWPHWAGTTLTFIDQYANGTNTLFAVNGRVAATRAIGPEVLGQGGSGEAAFSGDGQTFVLRGTDTLTFVRADGRTVAVHRPDGYAIWERSDIQTLSWLPDGSGIVTMACTVSPCYKDGEGGRTTLFLVSADGKTVRSLVDTESNVRSASVSPDGGAIVVVSESALQTLSLDGRVLRDIDLAALGGTRWPYPAKWSPDASRVAIQVGDFLRGSTRIAIIDPTGRIAPRLIGPPDANPRAWSPDGAGILAVSAGDPVGHLILIPTDGSPFRTLAPAARDGDWSWIPTGQADPWDAPSP